MLITGALSNFVDRQTEHVLINYNLCIIIVKDFRNHYVLKCSSDTSKVIKKNQKGILNN